MATFCATFYLVHSVYQLLQGVLRSVGHSIHCENIFASKKLFREVPSSVDSSAPSIMRPRV